MDAVWCIPCWTQSNASKPTLSLLTPTKNSNLLFINALDAIGFLSPNHYMDSTPGIDSCAPKINPYPLLKRAS